MTIMLACLVVVRNLRILESFDEKTTIPEMASRTRRRVPLQVLTATRPPP